MALSMLCSADSKKQMAKPFMGIRQSLLMLIPFRRSGASGVKWGKMPHLAIPQKTKSKIPRTMKVTPLTPLTPLETLKALENKGF
jgi:hypothetical protein